MKNARLSLRGVRLALLAFTLTAIGHAQTSPSIAFLGQRVQMQHNVGGLFLAPAYATWQATMISGNTATGSQSVIVTCNSGGVVGVCSLADGYSVGLATVFNTNTPIQILDNNAEIVTPSAVGSPAPCPSGFLEVGAATQCITVTATFANTHGGSAVIVSGDAGVEEAITDAGNAGGGEVYWVVDTGIVTLSTGGLTTTTTTKIPTIYYQLGAAAKVTTTITTSANWAVGISGATASLCSANSTLTAGTTCLANQVAPAVTGTTNALTAVLFTMGTSNPGAGAIKARLWGFTPVQATN